MTDSGLARKHLITACAGWLLWASLLLPGVRGLFHEAGKRWLYILIFSFLLALVFTPLARVIAFRAGALDKPAPRKVHKEPTALLGGLAIYLAFATALLANEIFDRSVAAILVAATGIVAVGVWDDIRPLSAKLKLAVQLAATALVFWAGIRITLFPAHGSVPALAALAQAGNAALTFLWIVGITNAMNFLDGIDGLAAGLGAVIAAILAIVAFQTAQPFLGWFSLAMLGSCLGFLPYNFRRKGPALIFLGDAGSTFIGFVLAALAIRGEWAKDNPLVSICTPIIIFGVPIFDMTQTTIARIATGKVKSFHDWVAYVGKDHIHHRMYRIFQGRRKTVLLILAINGCLGISAVVLQQVDMFHSLLLVGQSVLAFLMFAAVNHHQEKSILAADNQRKAARVHESFDVRVRMPDTGDEAPGVILDISLEGAKVLVDSGAPFGVGSRVAIAADTFTRAGIPHQAGTVVRGREVVLDNRYEGFMEYGIRFHAAEREAFLRLVEVLFLRQVARRGEELLAYLRPAAGGYVEK